MKPTLAAAWRGFRRALPPEVLAIELRPLPVLITAGTAVAITLAFWFEPHCRQWSGLRAAWPVLLAVGVGAAASLGTTAALRRGHRTTAYILQIFDFAGYASIPVLGIVLCRPPASYAFAAAYFIFTYHWAQVFGSSALLSLLVWGLPLALSFLGLPDLGGIVLVAVVGATYELHARNMARRRIHEARDLAHRGAVATVDQAVALAYEAARRDTAAEVSSAVHELGNLLVPTCVDLALLLEKESLGGEARESLESARAAAEEVTDRMGELLGEMRTKLREGGELFALSAALAELSGTRGGRLAKNGRRLLVEDAPDVEVPGKSAMLTDVLANMVSNAYEAGATRVEVRSALVDGGARVVVAVRDDGPGIEPEIKDRLFQPYVTHGKEHGVGLGLFVAAKVAQSVGGALTLAETGEKGTTFELTLPVGSRAMGQD